jgi:predicted O-methyltransferase YrrM
MNPVYKALRLGVRLVKIGLSNPRRLSHVLGTALVASEDVADRSLDLLRFPQVSVEDLLPESGMEHRIVLALVPKTNASVSVLEFCTLVLLLKRAGARNVFEFGTYKGVSITQLALNAASGGQIYTLDLPDEEKQTLYPISIAKDVAIARESAKKLVVPADVLPRIQFLKQDSARFDETPYAGTIDFVFVDGAHNLDYVRNDSEKGWRMLRAGGIIAWHDCCPQDADVVRYLLNSPFEPVRVLGTTLAFAQKGHVANR